MATCRAVEKEGKSGVRGVDKCGGGRLVQRGVRKCSRSRPKSGGGGCVVGACKRDVAGS